MINRIVGTYILQVFWIVGGIYLCHVVWAILSGRKPMTDGKTRVKNCPTPIVCALVALLAFIPIRFIWNATILTHDIYSRNGLISETIQVSHKSGVITWLPGGYAIWQEIAAQGKYLSIAFYPHRIKDNERYKVIYGRSSKWIVSISRIADIKSDSGRDR